MDNIKVYGIGLIAVVGLVFGYLGFSRGLPEYPVGAISGPDISSSYLSVNGVRAFYASHGMTKATTTICSFQSPNATSTLRTAVGNGITGANFSVSSTTASRITFAKATTAFATTTIIGSGAEVAANVKAYILASSTAAQQIAGDNIFAPSEWLVVGMQGGTGTFSPTGTCTAVFDVI